MIQKESNKEHRVSHSILNWSLAAFAFAVLAWLATFNILGAHTDSWRYRIYPAFESTYFHERDGARVFTFLGVYYMIAGAVILACLALGIHLPAPRPWLARSIRLPMTGAYWTVLGLCMLSLFVGVQAAVIVSRVTNKFYLDWVPVWDAAKLWYEVTKTLGKTCAITMLFLFIPVSKSCFWLDLFNLKFERAIKFHRWLAWFLVSVVVVHAASAVASLSSARQFKNCMWPSEKCVNPGRAWGTYESIVTSRRITYGWFCFVLAIPLVTTSLPWFRRHKFEWFYYTHFLFIPCMVLLHLHFQGMIYYAAPGLAATRSTRCCGSVLRDVRFESYVLQLPYEDMSAWKLHWIKVTPLNLDSGCKSRYLRYHYCNGIP